MRWNGPSLGLALALAAGGAGAQGYSLLREGGLSEPRPPFIETGPPGSAPRPLILARAEIADTAEAEEARGRAQSLFIGTSGGSFFAPFASRRAGRGPAFAALPVDDPEAELIRDLIADAEAGRDGYDAVQHGARRKPDRPPTQMTLGEIFAWIEATPRQPHAIGRYQFIPSTLARLVEIAGAGPDDRFSPELQDRLADILIGEAGLEEHRAGRLSRREFMNNLARIWAGFPNSSGRSHYHGYAGNAATMSWSQFEREMARIFRG